MCYNIFWRMLSCDNTQFLLADQPCAPVLRITLNGGHTGRQQCQDQPAGQMGRTVKKVVCEPSLVQKVLNNQS